MIGHESMMCRNFGNLFGHAMEWNHPPLRLVVGPLRALFPDYMCVRLDGIDIGLTLG
jgi:hypothetical protein